MFDDIIKIKVIYTRTNASTYTSIPVEFPIAIKEAVSLLAVHWQIESLTDVSALAVLMAALSGNPEHELNPPTGVAEFQSGVDLYGMATFLWAKNSGGTDWGYASSFGIQVVPLYGILRPKRQVAVFANIWNATVGIRGEIYYTEGKAPREVIDAISRRYGKYRRA